MVAVSTVNTVTLIFAFAIGRNIFLDFDGDRDWPWKYSPWVYELNPSTFPNGLAGALCTVLASWGADGFMVRLFKLKRMDVADHFIFSARYFGVRWCGQESCSTGVGDWYCWPCLSAYRSCVHLVCS